MTIHTLVSEFFSCCKWHLGSCSNIHISDSFSCSLTFSKSCSFLASTAMPFTFLFSYNCVLLLSVLAYIFLTLLSQSVRTSTQLARQSFCPSYTCYAAYSHTSVQIPVTMPCDLLLAKCWWCSVAKVERSVWALTCISCYTPYISSVTVSQSLVLIPIVLSLSLVCMWFLLESTSNGCIFSCAETLLCVQNYDTSESKLRREFDVYGPVRRVSYTVLLWHYINTINRKLQWQLSS